MYTGVAITVHVQQHMHTVSHATHYIYQHSAILDKSLQYMPSLRQWTHIQLVRGIKYVHGCYLQS